MKINTSGGGGRPLQMANERKTSSSKQKEWPSPTKANADNLAKKNQERKKKTEIQKLPSQITTPAGEQRVVCFTNMLLT